MPPFLLPSILARPGRPDLSLSPYQNPGALPQAFSLLRMLRPPGSPRSIDRLAINKVKLNSAIKALNLT